MGLSAILLRSIFVYVFLVVLLRLSGKRTIAQTTAFDFVLAIVLGDLLDDLLWAEVPASQFVAAMGTLVLLDIATSVAAFHSPAIEKLVDGSPRILVLNGVLERATLVRERLSARNAARLLRQTWGLSRDKWSEVRVATLEKDGKTSVLKLLWARHAQRADLERLRRKRR